MICLVLAFFALAVLPVNYVGLALMAIGLALFVAEAFVTSYGVLAIGGLGGGRGLAENSPARFVAVDNHAPFTRHGVAIGQVEAGLRETRGRKTAATAQTPGRCVERSETEPMSCLE